MALTDDELARKLESEYYATREGTPEFSDEMTLREFMHSRGFSFKWLTQHGYEEDDAGGNDE